MSKSVIINSGKGSNEIKKNMNSFNNFFTYISSKVVKDRIKVK